MTLDSNATATGRLYAPIEDVQFLRLWQIANERMLTEDELADLEMPAGASAHEVWHAITLLRRWSGSVVGLNESRLVEFWVNLPNSERQKARRIIERGAELAMLGRMAERRSYPAVNLHDQVGEIAAALRRDGAPLDHETLRAILTRAYAPKSPTEQLVANYMGVLLAEWEQPTAAGSIESIYERLTRGVLGRRGLGSGPVAGEAAVWDYTVLANCDRCLASAGDARGEEVLNLGSYLRGATFGVRLVDPYQTLLGSLLQKVLFIRSGHGCLSLLPFCAVAVASSKPETDERAFDITERTARYLDATSDLLDDLANVLAANAQREQALHAAIDGSPRLTMRQKDALHRIVNNPDEVLDYDEYTARYQASYNTARSDLGKLVNAGVLYTTSDGRRVAFHATPHAMRAIEGLT